MLLLHYSHALITAAGDGVGYTLDVGPRKEEVQAKVQNPKHRARRRVIEVPPYVVPKPIPVGARVSAQGTR